MKLIGKIILWLFLWPIMLPIWLWKRGKTGKILGGVWTLLFLCLAVVVLVSPKQTQDQASTSRATSGPVIAKGAPTVANAPERKDTPKPEFTPVVTNTPAPTNAPGPTNTPAPTGVENVSIGNPSTADSEQSSGHSAAKGNDADPSTRWCATDSGLNHWWMVDLGTAYDLTRTEVRWEYDRKVYEYRVEVSADKRNWLIAADQTRNTRSTQVQSDNFTARGRYVRITVTGLPPGAWASFFEFSVFGIPAPTPTPTPTPTPPSPPWPATATAAALAAEASATAAAQATEAAATVVAQATEATATAAAQATEAAAAIATQAIKSTATAYACLNASYMADVSVPDGTRLDANASFVKTWRVKNTGKCDWTQGVIIAFESGDRLNAPFTAPVGSLQVGQHVDVSVPMRAPVQAGRYTGVWRMQDGSGRFFGERLTVNILVGGSASNPRPPSTVVVTQPVRAPAPIVVPPASSECCKHCGPSSKPCGDSCISLSKQCHKLSGCACP